VLVSRRVDAGTASREIFLALGREVWMFGGPGGPPGNGVPRRPSNLHYLTGQTPNWPEASEFGPRLEKGTLW
jgi:hypothetical protein